MMTGARAKWLVIAAIAAACFSNPAKAQTCDTLLGGVSCNRASADQSPARSDWNFGSVSGSPGLGSDLLTGRSDDDTAMLGGIVFGGSGATCMGPFRWRKC